MLSRIFEVAVRMHMAPVYLRMLLALGVCSTFAGCLGDLDGGPASMGGNAVPRAGSTDFACGSGVSTDPPMLRLSERQYHLTLEAVLEHYFEGESGTILSAVSVEMGSYPDDAFLDHPTPGQRLFARSDQAFTGSLVSAQLSIAMAIGNEVTTGARLATLAGDCATDGSTTNDGACLDDLVNGLGLWTHRRPLEPDEFDFYRHEAYIDGDAISPVGIAELVAIMLSQPHFVMHVEGTGALTPYELASRLSYQFWDTMPDEALFASAATDLMTESGWNAAIERVLDDPRTDGTLSNFLDEWWKRDVMVPLSVGGGPDVDAFTEGVNRGAVLDEAIDQELHDLFVDTVRSGGSFRDFFLSDETTTTNPDLAAIYGIAPSTDGSPVALPIERHGVLTRVGALIPRADISPPATSTITHPVLRGVFIRRQILCDNIPPPPPGAMNDLPTITGMVTSRERWQTLTGSGTCNNCHRLLNPPGFALEGFDPIGRYRREEQFFAGASMVGVLPVDDTATLPDMGVASGGRELSDLLYDSERPGACFARHYVRFTLARAESLVNEGCLLREVDEAVDADRPLREVLTLPLLSPNYRVRSAN